MKTFVSKFKISYVTCIAHSIHNCAMRVQTHFKAMFLNLCAAKILEKHYSIDQRPFFREHCFF